MNNKKLILCLAAASMVLSFSAKGSDVVDVSSEAYRSQSTVPYSRWSIIKVGAEANTPWGTTSITNVVATTSSVVGRIFFVPGAVSDTFKMYNAATGATATTSTLVYETTANSPVMGNSPVQALGTPIAVDLLPGWSCTSGIVTILTRSVTTTGSKAYISYDQARP
jgi:hypothetical protein